MKRLLIPSTLLLLSACGSNLEGTSYADKEGNTLTFRPKGELSLHTDRQDLEFHYEVAGSKITVRDLKRKEGFQLVNFLRLLDDGSIRALDGTRLVRKEK